jgi:hypothetical protein
MLLHINGIFTSFVLNRPSQSMLSHRSRYLYVVSHISNSMIYIDTVKPVKLLLQVFLLVKLKSSLSKSYGHHHDLVNS